VTSAPDTWFFPPGWKTAHLIRQGVTPAHTLCGRRAEGGLGTAPADMRRCGQCERRRPAPQYPDRSTEEG
jgi:hypothetical protein